MARDIDEKKTRKALRKLRKAKSRAEAEDGPGLTEWEQEFFEGVEERLEKFGSAFIDPEKGTKGEALSARQSQIVKQVDKKSRQKKPLKRSSFNKKSFKSATRDVNSDIEDLPPQEAPSPQELQSKAPSLSIVQGQNSCKKRPSRSKQPFELKVINGGKA